jgi:sigma-B regulation protein RsbU (phosphoserine phosphatase)
VRPRKELSPEIQAVLDQAACGLLQTDASGVLLRVNRTFCQWLGYAPHDLVGTRKLQDLLTMGGRIFHQTHWAPLLQIQGSVSEVKLELVHHDRHLVPMVLNAIRRQEGDEVVHDIAAYVARDRDKYERELVESRKRLEVLVAEATRMQEEARDRASFAEQMVGIVSHDLRNPLSTIQMGAALLARGNANPQQLNVLGRLSRAADRADRLIADLLDFTQARLGSGLSVSPKPVDLHALIAESVDELAQAFPGRKLIHLRDGAGEIAIDADRITQLLGNLVGNAMTYGRPESVVTVTTTVAENSCGITVHNEGPAIPSQRLAELFKPMARGSGAIHAPRSVGLGLFIVAQIVKAHRGTVSVTSDEQSGTSFTITLPRTLASQNP